MLGIFWKLYVGNPLMETMCWEIWVNAGGFCLTMTQVSVVQGTRPLRSTAPGTFAIITLVRYLSMELHKGDLQLVLPAEPPAAPVPGTFVFLLVRHISMELYKENHWPNPLNTAQLTH